MLRPSTSKARPLPAGVDRAQPMHYTRRCDRCDSTYTYTHTTVHTDTYTFEGTHICIHPTHMHTDTYDSKRTHLYIHTSTHPHIHTSAHPHIRIRRHPQDGTHTHTHTYMGRHKHTRTTTDKRRLTYTFHIHTWPLYKVAGNRLKPGCWSDRWRVFLSSSHVSRAFAPTVRRRTCWP